MSCFESSTHVSFWRSRVAPCFSHLRSIVDTFFVGLTLTAVPNLALTRTSVFAGLSLNTCNLYPVSLFKRNDT